MFTALLVAGVLALAYTNGANDVFKAVATLAGSRLGSFSQARLWAVLWTVAGAALAVYVGEGLAVSFSGAGLFADPELFGPVFGVAVTGGAAATVLIATRLGLPVSTTHALLGALLGAGMASGATPAAGALWTKFLVPLLVSPILACVLTLVIYRSLKYVAPRLLRAQDACLCVTREHTSVSASGEAAAIGDRLRVVVAESDACEQTGGRIAAMTMSGLHLASSAAVSFARALNDTPKIAGILLLLPSGDAASSMVMVGAAMAIGGWLSCYRVGKVMSRDITGMAPSEGTVGNLVTSGVTLAASFFVLPVSTTHVSCGALFGIGASNGELNCRTLAAVITAWLITLPLAAALAFVATVALELL